MKFWVMMRAYNSYGGHKTLSPIGDFLLLGAPSFGAVIKEITVTLHIPHQGPANKTLEQLLDRHNAHRAKLPTITYYRKKGAVEIAIASDLLAASDPRHTPRLSLPLFTQGVDEVIRALSLLRKKLKPADAFDLAAFLAHCERARHRIPATEDALQELAAQLAATEQARRDALSPWEKLDIDWGAYHPRARAILDDPFFWEGANDFAPHGNDTGFDLLAN